MPRLPSEGSLATPKILSAGATLHVGPIRLQVENWECRALKSSARWQFFFFSACKWGFNTLSHGTELKHNPISGLKKNVSV